MDQYKIICDNGRGLFGERLKGLYESVKCYLEAEQDQQRRLSYTKVFLSDISNQEIELRQSPLMNDFIGRANYTIIQQSPIGGAKIGLLLKTSDETDAFSMHSLRKRLHPCPRPQRI